MSPPLHPTDPGQNNVGPLLVLGGVGLAVYGLVLGLDEPRRVYLGAAVLVAGTLMAARGRARWMAWSRHNAAAEAAVPDAQRLRGDLAGLAQALRGRVLAATQVGLGEALREDDEATWRPERFERVALEREGLELVVYSSDLDRSYARVEGGPGIVADQYWRVRCELPLPCSFHITGRHEGHALAERLGGGPSLLGDPTLDSALVVHGDQAWVRAHLSPALRALLLRWPSAVVRAFRGRVEVLWPTSAVRSVGRFEDAVSVVTLLAQAMAAPPR